MLLNKRQQKKSVIISYLLLLLINAKNSDQLFKYLEKESKRYKFLMAIRELVYHNDSNLNDIILFRKNDTFIVMYNLDAFIDNILRDSNKDVKECKFINNLLTKEHLSDHDSRNTLSNILVIYFEGRLNDEICALYYNALQPQLI